MVSIVLSERAGIAAADEALRFLSLHNSYEAVEVIVLVDAAVGTAAHLEEAWSSTFHLRVLEVEAGRPGPEAINAAAAVSTGEFLLVVGEGVRMADDCIQAMVRTLSDPQVGAVGVQLRSVEPAKAGPATIVEIGVRFRWGLKGRRLSPEYAKPGPSDVLLASRPSRFPALSGAFMMCRRSDFVADGGLDPAYETVGAAAIDLSLRLRLSLGKAQVSLNDRFAVRPPTAPSRDLPKRDRRRLQSWWGYALRREFMLERWNDDGSLTGRPLSVGFAVTTTDMADGTGDIYTAWGLGQALKRLYGWNVVFLPQDQWRQAAGLDLYVSMRDKTDVTRLKGVEPHLVKAAWMRNWIDRWSERSWFMAFDLRLTSSAIGAAFIQRSTGLVADVLPIGVSRELFGPGPSRPWLATDCAFTGNRWQNAPAREIEEFDPNDLTGRFRVFGKNWSDHPVFGPFDGGFAPYQELGAVYNSTKITIDDSVFANRPWGSLNSRVFEALACGSLVVTNDVAGSDELFGGRLPVWKDAPDLQRVLAHYLGHPRERREAAAALQQEVLAHHTYEHRAQRLREIVFERIARPVRVAIKCPAPHPDEAHAWGDYHFSKSLKRALERRGYAVRIDLLPDWHGPGSLSDDVAIVLRGLSAYETTPDQINICWLLSHPDKVSVKELNAYDHVFVASDIYVEKLTQSVRTGVSPLLQCSDPEVFHPTGETAAREDYLFVGNSRRQDRPVVRHCIEAGLPLGVYGREWDDLLPAGMLRAEHVENHLLHQLYGSAKIVLNDHWPDMAREGFASNRIYDVALSEGLLISTDFAGSEQFSELVITYRSANELKALGARWLVDEQARTARARRARQVVLERHTFDHRAAEIAAVIATEHERRLRGPSATATSRGGARGSNG